MTKSSALVVNQSDNQKYRLEAQAFLNLGISYHRLLDFEQATHCLQQALQFASEIPDIGLKGQSMLELSCLLSDQGFS